MDKQHILNIYKNIVDKEGVFLKSIDLLDTALRYYEMVVTPFLSPEIRAVLEEIIRFEDVITVALGGFEDAERVRLVILQPYMEPPKPDAYVRAIRIAYKQKFNQLTHRDCMGAILGLGITRQKLGDIQVTDTHIDCVVDPELVDYIIANLEKVGRAGVAVQHISLSEMTQLERKTELMSDTVKSLRLDAVIASAYHLSRGDAQHYISADQVKVNHREVQQGSLILKEGDLISVRGKGRFTLNSVEGTTRKERIRIVIAHYTH